MSLFEIAGQLKIDFQKLILGKVLIFMKLFENVFCYFRYSLNLVFWNFKFDETKKVLWLVKVKT